jgi:hypothetical protein
MIVAVTRGEWIFAGVVAFFVILLVLTLWRVSVQPKTRGWRLGLYFERDVNVDPVRSSDTMVYAPDPTEAKTEVWPKAKEPDEQ